MQQERPKIENYSTFTKEIEIERKWSVRKKQIPDLTGFDKIEIEQGYFKDHNGKTRRLRKFVDKNGKVFYQEQFKTKLGDKRSDGSEEESRFLSEDEFSILWPQTEGVRIKKTRYYIPYRVNLNGEEVELKIELDFFQNGEIVMAEVEFTNKEQSDWFTSDKWPNWFKKDITDNKGVSSKSIAKKFGDKID